MKRVLFFGIFDPEYARTRVFTEGFTALGYEVVSCRVDPRIHSGWRKYKLLLEQGRALRKEPFDRILVLFPGHTVVWLARLLFGNRIIFDAFVSLHDSNVHDRRRYKAYSLRACTDWLLDRLSCALARTVLVDTAAHLQYFVEHIGVSSRKILSVPVGASLAWFAPKEKSHAHKESRITTVGFYGSYIPLHGLATIVRAALLLKGAPIRFKLIGDGQEYLAVQKLADELGGAPNVEFLPRMSLDALINEMNSVDICLGIFGGTEKAGRVIPNKVFECAALGKPVITADTPAIREVFTDQQNIFLVPTASEDSLAKAISSLASDRPLRQRLGAAARERMANFTPKEIVSGLLHALQKRVC